MELIIRKYQDLPIESKDIEVVEHKGKGHPDTFCDACCEAASNALSKYYLKRFGKILHHNVDKGLLVAGTSNPKFNGGKIIRPFKIIVAGRATNKAGTETIDVNKIVLDSVEKLIKQKYRISKYHIEADILPGAANLQDIFKRKSEVPLANDTSIGVGFAPLSRLENVVLNISKILEDNNFLKKHPYAGDDFKILGIRNKDEIKITLAVAFIGKFVKDTADYFNKKEDLRKDLMNKIKNVQIDINALDDHRSKDESGIYLTVSGMSAEMGDDGNTGRGNRVNGLNTPGRPMTMECAAGKNSVSHVGKIYNVLANLIAKEISDKTSCKEVYVRMVSTIGKPINQPQLFEVLVDKLDGNNKNKIKSICLYWLKNITKISKLVVDEKVRIY